MTSFYPKRIPVLNFFTGSHDDYHRTTDTSDKINYEGLERIAKFARAIVQDVATAPGRPDFSRVQRKEQGGGRNSMRAYLGSMDRLLLNSCLGQIPEILDGDTPHTQRGCDAQAWGVTEALRVWKFLQEPAV